MSNVDKLANTIQRELSLIFQREVKDPKIGFVTVTGVTVTNDLSIAKVYVTFLGKYSSQNMKALDKTKGFVRSQLAKKLKVRKCPELQFILDDSLEYGNKIESIINELNKE